LNVSLLKVLKVVKVIFSVFWPYFLLKYAYN